MKLSEMRTVTLKIIPTLAVHTYAHRTTFPQEHGLQTD